MSKSILLILLLFVQHIILCQDTITTYKFDEEISFEIDNQLLKNKNFYYGLYTKDPKRNIGKMSFYYYYLSYKILPEKIVIDNNNSTNSQKNKSPPYPKHSGAKRQRQGNMEGLGCKRLSI